MVETFYGVLGVEADADSEAIEAAYREQVKQSHPDVTDDPDASERFKRLTTARDVLVDADERARYDRLGHAAYVRQHVESSVWTVDGDEEGGPASETADADVSRGRSGAAGGVTHRRTSPAERQTWLGDDWDRTRHDAAATVDGDAYGGRGWQRASASGETTTGSTRGRSRRDQVAAGARRIGPWLPIYAVFILSAIATGWFTFTGASDHVTLSLPMLLGGVVVFTMVVFISTVHLFAQLYG